MSFRFSKIMIAVLLSLFLFVSAGSRPVYAVDKSRFFTCFLFLSGLGSSVAGAVLQGQANETYDEYLHTAVQADMNSFIDDYDQKHQQSLIASRAGIGLVIGAILISLIDAAHIEQPEAEEAPPLFGSEIKSFGEQIVSANTRNGEVLISIGSRF